MFAALAMAGLSAAGSLMQGIGASQASAKQARLQAIADATARNENQKVLDEVNAYKRAAGQMLVDMSHPSVAVAEAEAAGFNPVTWLSAGYGTRMQSLASAYELMTPAYQLQSASQVPQQHSMLSAFGGALSAGASAFGTQYRADQSYNLQLDRMMLSSQAGNFGGSAFSPAYYGGAGGTVRSASGGGTVAGTGGLSSSLGWPDHGSWKPGKNEVTAWSPVAPVDPYSADVGGSLTQRGGEPYEWLFFGPTLVSDTLKSWTGKGLYEWGVHNGASIGVYRKPEDVGIWPAITRWWNDPKTDYRLGGFSGNAAPYIPFAGGGAGVTHAW